MPEAKCKAFSPFDARMSLMGKVEHERVRWTKGKPPGTRPAQRPTLLGVGTDNGPDIHLLRLVAMLCAPLPFHY
jgi:hypothetical protein